MSQLDYSLLKEEGIQKEKIGERKFACQRGNLTIRGTEYRPAGELLPAAIVSHGFMANQNTVREYAEFLAELGFVSYCFDFCGGSLGKNESDGETTEMSVKTEMEDLKAVIDYVQSLPYTNEELVLMGCSQGGFVSALVAAQLKEKVSKLVLFYPAFCIPHDARAGQMMHAKFDPKNPPEIIMCGEMRLGKCYPEAVMDMDPYQETKNYPGPVLLVHGTCDHIVNIEYAKCAVDSYKNRPGNAPVEFVVVEGAKHSFEEEKGEVAKEAVRKFVVVLE